MKCSHCDYEDHWVKDIYKEVKGKKVWVDQEYFKGDEGQFFKSPLFMRNEDGEEIDVYGCPRCMKVFISY